ncbi:hypothetical protein [Calidifontibacter indicus]|uniref:hypothetical protein n=1 Tax=Calidifontibacter indicus TaxID=419650 RepID=UPI0014757F65|nr:hypothetical protein [Calidifontibacter indicus]
MNNDMSEIARRQERFRAMMIGLALGDARLGPDGETLVAGAATDLAMRQLHALIRSWRPQGSRNESTLTQATINDLQSSSTTPTSRRVCSWSRARGSRPTRCSKSGGAIREPRSKR